VACRWLVGGYPVGGVLVDPRVCHFGTPFRPHILQLNQAVLSLNLLPNLATVPLRRAPVAPSCVDAGHLTMIPPLPRAKGIPLSFPPLPARVNSNNG